MDTHRVIENVGAVGNFQLWKLLDRVRGELLISLEESFQSPYYLTMRWKTAPLYRRVTNPPVG